MKPLLNVVKNYPKSLELEKLSENAKEAFEMLMYINKGDKILQIVQGIYNRRIGVLAAVPDQLLFLGLNSNKEPIIIDIPFDHILNIISIEEKNLPFCTIKILTREKEVNISGCNIEKANQFIETVENRIEQEFDFYSPINF
jgi:hypothetical protein